MKLLALAVLFVSSFQVSALAADSSGQVALSAGTSTQTLQLVDQKYDPVYSQVPYETTCSRQVFDHNETQCSTTTDSVCSGGGQVCDTVNDTVCNSSGCTNVPRRECHDEAPTCTDVPRQVCNDVPVYRTEYYTCTQYETEQTGQTLAKTYNHSVTVSVKNADILAAGNLNVSVFSSQDKVTATLSNSYASALLNYTVSVTSSNDTGDTLNQAESIVIDVAASADALKAFQTASMTGLALGQNGFRFNIPGAGGLENSLNIAVKLVRTPALWFKSTKLDKTFASSNLSLVGQGADINAIIPWSKLGVDPLSNVRYSLYVTASLNLGTILNPSDFQGALDKKVSQSIEKSNPSF